ncbi:MAG TPA: ABC transporter substrate-binding protein [Gemmatimonadales bacterium]|jgi:peptide/nickel transport system substrate-binding protein/oligopeptide transport system substrate-binding protein|nr:ABC transporter substrate-binding protein [Gemmatimonadales bacterium]
MPRPAAVLLALLLAACGSGIPPGLKYSWDADPRSLDPALSTDVPTGEAVTLLFDNLTQFDVEGRLIPGLASRWWPSPDGATWTFRLRPGVTFHDGRPLDAAAIVASFLRALRMGNEGGRVWPLLPIAGAGAVVDSGASHLAGLMVVDDSTLAFRLTAPLNIFPKLLAMPVAAIVPTPTPANFGDAPIGSGPWRFVSWSHDDLLVLARNDHWWGGPALSDTLRIRIIPEPFTQGAEYEAGRLSVVDIPVGETERWEREHGPEIQRRASLEDWYVAINTTRGALADVRVRQALNHAINIPAILTRVMHNRGVLAAGSIPPGLDGYDSTRKRYAFDPARARALLAAAGHAHDLHLQLWRTPKAEFARIAQAIQSDLADVGVTVEVVERDPSTARAAARNGEADLFLSDWFADYPDGEDFSYPLFYSGNAGTGGNYAFLHNAALDSLLIQARTTPDSLTKVRLLRDIDARVFALAPWIFCWFPTDLWAMRPEVHGWRYPLVFTGQRWTTVSITP